MPQPQQTIAQPATLHGIGLHSGQKVTMTIHPAPPDTGIRFRRTDLEGKPEIPATIHRVTDTTRSTTLSKGNIRLHTVEHTLAALRGADIDNATIELNANEPPIGDGSARPYTQIIKNAGTKTQNQPRQTLTITTPITHTDGQTTLTLLPHPTYKITCTSTDTHGHFTQHYSTEINPQTWHQQLAHARTFCFYDEIQHLIKNGLIKGGSLENAIIIRDDAILTNQPLRYPEELVRHKILDIIGDLALIGKPINGHLIAIRPNHKANCQLARQLTNHTQTNHPTKQPNTQTTTPNTPTKNQTNHTTTPQNQPNPTQIDTQQIMKILPHRYPLLMIDRVLKIDQNHITCLKNITINEPYFQGHFPNHPIMPGVLQLEAIAQAAGLLTLNKPENWGKIAYFLSAENVKWRKPVKPGDTLHIHVQLSKNSRKIGKGKGTCYVNNQPVSQATVTFILRNDT